MFFRNEKGITLLELLAAILILGIIASITIPTFTNLGEGARVRTHISNIQSIEKAMELMSVKQGIVHLETLSDFGILDGEHSLLLSGYIKDEPTNPWEGTNANQSGSDGYDYYYVITKDIRGNFLAYLVGFEEEQPKTVLIIEDKKDVELKDLSSYSNLKFVEELTETSDRTERLIK